MTLDAIKYWLCNNSKELVWIFFFLAEGLYSMVIGAFLQKQAGYLPSASSACGTYVTFPVLGLEVLLYHLST